MVHNSNFPVVRGVRSVRNLGGTFYDTNYNTIFTPLTEKEHIIFLQRVSAAENRAHRLLTYDELMRLTEHMANL